MIFEYEFHFIPPKHHLPLQGQRKRIHINSGYFIPIYYCLCPDRKLNIIWVLRGIDGISCIDIKHLCVIQILKQK